MASINHRSIHLPLPERDLNGAVLRVDGRLRLPGGLDGPGRQMGRSSALCRAIARETGCQGSLCPGEPGGVQCKLEGWKVGSPVVLGEPVSRDGLHLRYLNASLRVREAAVP